MIDTFVYFFLKVPWGFWFFFITFFLGAVAWTLWLHYIRQSFIAGIDFVLLEIIPPREVVRSPAAMELFFTNALYHFSNKGGAEEYWQGAVRFWFSLEIASIDGQVHFYIRTPTRLKDLIETQMYAQYPQAQLRVAEDYTLAVDEIVPHGKWKLWGCEFGLLKHEAYPIKTYADFGLDEDPKEEYKVDPISPVIELFGSIKKGEQMWMQIIVMPSKKKYHTKGTLFKHHDWVEQSKIEIRDLLEPYTGARERADKPGVYGKEIRSPKYLDDSVKGMSEKTNKLGFDTGIRICYVAKAENFDPNSRRNMRLIFRQYANPDRNQFNRVNSTQADAYGSIFTLSQDKVTRISNRMLEEYRERAFFYPPLRHHLLANIPWPISPAIFPAYKHHHTFVLNVEEMATIFHFPGQILKVPTLERIESKEASPPTNLPI